MLTVLLLAIFSITLPVSASTEEFGTKVSASFVNSASVDIKTRNDGITEISVYDTAKVPTNTYSSKNGNSFVSKSLTFLADTEEERNEILSRIKMLRDSGGGTTYNEDWFLGSSCYIYISVTYSTRETSLGTEARIDSVTTKHSVNSGTYVSDANLHILCIGHSSTSGSAYYEENIEVNSTPYTTTLPSSWPYVDNGGPALAADYTVTATRPSGESSTHKIVASVFLN